jgi:HEPN domain-containing protein
MMVDIEKQISYWRNGSSEDWAVAKELVERGRIRHGLFFAHLALEKALKAHVCRSTRDLAPPIHNLVRLANKASLMLSQAHMETLAEMNAFNVEGRYPESLIPAPSRAEAQAYLERGEEVFRWLISML